MHGDFTGISQVAAQGEAFPGAVVDTGAAVHAGFQVNAPGAAAAVHSNGAGGAGAHALAAEDAAADVVDDPAPVMGLVNLRFYGIGGGYRRLEHVGEGLFHVNEKTHGVPPYLSQQLMQGSMVRMMLGTSASSQPFSIFTRAARLALVGVRRRNRSRFFVPFPFT